MLLALQVLLWSLGDHVSTLADGTAGSFDGVETRVAARTVLKVSIRDLLCVVLLIVCLAEMAAALSLGVKKTSPFGIPPGLRLPSGVSCTAGG